MIEFSCPHCQTRIRVSQEAAGRTGKCKICSKSVVVPHPNSIVELPTDLGSALDEVLSAAPMAQARVHYAESENVAEKSGPPTQSTEPLIRCNPYTKRSYVHVRCGGKTTVEEGTLSHLLNPFRFVNMTICAACGAADMTANFEWTDTNERVHYFRSRVFREVPLHAKLVLFVVVPLLTGIALYLALPLLPAPGKNGGDPKVIAMLAIPFGYLIGVMTMVMTPLSNLVAFMCGVRFNTYK